MEDLDLKLLNAVSDHRKTLRGDVVIPAVVVTGDDHLLERATVVDRKRHTLGQYHAELECGTNGVAVVETGIRIEQIREDAGTIKRVETLQGRILRVDESQSLKRLTKGWLAHRISLLSATPCG